MTKAYINALSEGSKQEILEWLVKVDAENDTLRERIKALETVQPEERRIQPFDIREWHVINGILEHEKAGYKSDQAPVTPVELFVHEYEDADDVQAEAFRERLLTMLNAVLSNMNNGESSR